jgi:long-chain fatty acid transport protein
MGLAGVGQALGSGFQLRENSAAALGNAFAGAAASTEDPSVIANNPAGMTGLSGNQVSGDLSIVIPSAIFPAPGSTRPVGRSAEAMAATQEVRSQCPRSTVPMTPHRI